MLDQMGRQPNGEGGVMNIEAIKRAVEITHANCETCMYFSYDGDGYEYNSEYPVCNNEKRRHVENLKSFPFKTEQQCWNPNFWHSKFVRLIKLGEEKEIDEAYELFTQALKKAEVE